MRTEKEVSGFVSYTGDTPCCPKSPSPSAILLQDWDHLWNEMDGWQIHGIYINLSKFISIYQKTLIMKGVTERSFRGKWSLNDLFWKCVERPSIGRTEEASVDSVQRWEGWESQTQVGSHAGVFFMEEHTEQGRLQTAVRKGKGRAGLLCTICFLMKSGGKWAFCT